MELKDQLEVQSVTTSRNMCKVKVPHNRLESLEGSRGVTLHFLDLGARKEWVISTTPQLLYPWKRPVSTPTGI
jgi:hypothetical protein